MNSAARVEIEVCGAVCGTTWMPARLGCTKTRKTYILRGEDRPFARNVDSVREALELTAAEDGDFQTAGKLTADTIFLIKSRSGNREVRRHYAVVDFPVALAGLVDFDVYAQDFFGED